MPDLDHDSDLIGLDAGAEADPELVELHRELEGLEISERPSFGPELLAELEGTWRSEAVLPMRRRRWPRVAAAMAAGLVLAFASVPTARAAFFRFVAAAAPEPADVTELPPAPETRFLAIPELQPATDGVLSGPTPDTRAPTIPDLVLPDEGVRFVPAPVSYAELRDRRASQATVRSFYPAGLQEAGVAGVVTLELWVDETGVVSDARLATSSGVPGLDQAAIAAAPFLRFYPAVDRGRPVGTWVRFDLEFTGLPEGALAFPDVEDPEEPDLIDLGGPDLLLASPWAPGPTVLPDPFPLDGAELLAEALGSASVEDVAGLGSAAGILASVPPEGASAVRWRESVARALEAAITQQPQNPAPYLALGRLRAQQGLPTEAEVLFAEGILRVDAARRAIPPRVVGDLHYERALIDQGHWRATAHSGRIPVRAFRDEGCEGVTAARGEAGFATAGELISRNVLCSDELASIRERDFRPTVVGSSPETWIGDLEAAVEAFPGHVAAGTELVLGLLDLGEWEEAGDRARAVETASGGEPVMTLLRGVAAYRAGRISEGATLMDRGLGGLIPRERGALESPQVFLRGTDAARYAAMSSVERSTFAQRYWAERDPRISSPENERRLEHVARTTYASLRFGSLDADGARAWVLLGRPEARWAVGSGGEPRTEFWDYGPGPDLVFSRSAEGVDYRLDRASRTLMESAVEVADSASYSSAGVTLLSGQATVLRASTGTALQFRAALDLSPLLGSQPATVTVACYLIPASGEAIPISRFTRYGARETLDLDGELPAGAQGTVVVEVERGSGMVGTYRFPVSGPSTPGAAHVSSLTLMTPEPGWDLDGGSGSFETLRGMPADWRIHHDMERLPVGALGLYLELYDLPAGPTGQNRFELVLRDPTGVQEWSVPVVRTNTSDQVALHGEWSVEYLGAARQPAFAVISLPAVDPGAYELLLTVSGPGFDEPVLRSRTIRVR